jgi:hypothetical protein
MRFKVHTMYPDIIQVQPHSGSRGYHHTNVPYLSAFDSDA